MLQSSLQPTEHKAWKIIFIILSVIILIGMPLLSKDYGQSADEWVQMEYGHDIWNYFKNGDTQALNYDNKSMQYSHLEYYGGLFDFSMHALHEWVPGVPILTLRHFFNALLGALIVIFTGLLARRLSDRWIIGLLAFLFMLFSPRIFGESMNNPKDIPFAAGFVIGVYGIIALLQDYRKKIFWPAAAIALGWGIAYGVRPAGGLLLGGYFVIFTVLYYFMNKEFQQTIKTDKKSRNKFLLGLIVPLLIGYVVGMLAWPWGLQSPLSNPIVALQGMTNREMNIRVLFEGIYMSSQSLPWYYEFKWLIISNPLTVIAGLLVFIALMRSIGKKYSNYVLILVLFTCFFPLLYMIYKKSTVYDTWRHVFFVYPFWVTGSALGWGVIEDFIKKEQLKFLPYIIAFIGLFPVIGWYFKSHPNEYVYFNELQGGPAGVNGYYDLDYYQNTGKQAADWILKNAKPIPGRKITVRSNMSAIDKYFEKDTSWIIGLYGRYGERTNLDWDYYIATPRYISPYMLQNDLWPPSNAVYTIAIDGAPLSAVLKRNCVEGFTALHNKELDKAISLYESCITNGDKDGDVYYNYGVALASAGRMDEGIAALKKAIEKEPASIEYRDILSRIYQAIGDQANYQKTVADIQAIMMRDNEYEEE